MKHSAAKLNALKAEGKRALVAYLPMGFPDHENAIVAARAAIEAGADIIELGFPYSDPVLDGPIIQQATSHALQQGFRTRQMFEAVEQVAQLDAPVLVMSYYNPLYKYGIDALARDLDAAGGAGLITPDLTPEYATDWINAADQYELDKVFLVAPSSSLERISITAQASRGFVYAASTMGVTGLRSELSNSAQELVSRTRSVGAENICMGIGVSNAEQARDVAEYADGVIVGSAFVHTLLGDDPVSKRIDALQAKVSELAEAIH